MTQDEIITYFTGVLNNPATWGPVSTLFDQYVSNSNMTVGYMRSFMKLGGPLNINGTVYQNKTDRAEEQAELYTAFALQIKETITGRESKMLGLGFQSLFGYFPLILEEFFNLILVDSLMALASAAFVFIYLCFHLRSKFLAFIGITIILFSYPVTLAITEGIL